MRNTLMHHGVKDQKWGVRRYQNEDGSRTYLGKQHENALKREQRAANGMVYFSTTNRAAANRKNDPDNIDAEEEQDRTNAKAPHEGMVDISTTNRAAVNRKNDPDNIAAEEEDDSPVLKSNKSTFGTIQIGSAATTKILRSDDVAKPIYATTNFEHKIGNGKKIAALCFKSRE